VAGVGIGVGETVNRRLSGMNIEIAFDVANLFWIILFGYVHQKLSGKLLSYFIVFVTGMAIVAGRYVWTSEASGERGVLIVLFALFVMFLSNRFPRTVGK
jgi:hypothetical protein